MLDAQSLIEMVQEAQFETEEEWRCFHKKVMGVFNQLPESEQEIIIEDNSLESLAMIISAFEGIE